MNGNLFGAVDGTEAITEILGPASTLHRGFALRVEAGLLSELERVTTHAPFRHMVTPGGFTMSVAMTNCGSLGWITDRAGYRYDATDPITGKHWPPMPDAFTKLAADAANQSGYAGFEPDACLINRYGIGAKMSLHQDKDERDFQQPIVSVSLGLDAVFQFGGLKRADQVNRFRLRHGDVVVWGGADRLRYHGVLPLKEGQHAALGSYRINLTFRKAG